MTTKPNPIEMFADQPIPLALTEAGKATLYAVPPQPSGPSVRPGFRLVPTNVGRNGDFHTVWIECPATWCTINHSAEYLADVEDVWHGSDFVDFNLPHQDGGPELLVYGRIGLDEYSSDERMRVPHLFMEDGFTANGRHLTPEDGEQLAANAEAFARQVRALAAECRTLAAEPWRCKDCDTWNGQQDRRCHCCGSSKGGAA